MQGVLQKIGYDVVLAQDGLSACRLLLEPESPRIALIDWMMPELDGPNVCREIRRRRHDSYIYIALLTSKQGNADIVEGLEAGADDYLTKPCHPAELKARLMTGKRILRYEDKLVESREAMRHRATHDALTQLWNRGAVLSHLRHKLETCERNRSDVSVLLCDVDHFKKVNDTHGHLAGDAVLTEVSARLVRSIRKVDRVGRYGGEEFLIVLDGCGAQDVERCAEQVRLSVNSDKVRSADLEFNTSISIGATSFHSGRESASAEELLHRADMALYSAKANGRNCTVIWDSALEYSGSRSDR
jgi:diguanylate cyclase (GGDEF)-like protein